MAVMYTYRNHQYTAEQLASRAPNGITAAGFRNRIRRGYSVKDAITEPLMNKKRDIRYPCGATSWRDCLECPHKIMRCLSYPAMPGENAGNFAEAEWKKGEKQCKTREASGSESKTC